MKNKSEQTTPTPISISLSPQNSSSPPRLTLVEYFNPKCKFQTFEIFALGLKEQFRYSWNFEFTRFFRPLNMLRGLSCRSKNLRFAYYLSPRIKKSAHLLHKQSHNFDFREASQISWQFRDQIAHFSRNFRSFVKKTIFVRESKIKISRVLVDVF